MENAIRRGMAEKERATGRWAEEDGASHMQILTHTQHIQCSVWVMWVQGQRKQVCPHQKSHSRVPQTCNSTLKHQGKQYISQNYTYARN